MILFTTAYGVLPLFEEVVLKEKGFPNSLWQKIQNSHLTKMLTILGATEKAEEPLLI